MSKSIFHENLEFFGYSSKRIFTAEQYRKVRTIFDLSIHISVFVILYFARKGYPYFYDVLDVCYLIHELLNASLINCNSKYFIIFSNSISEVCDISLERENYFCVVCNYFYNFEDFINCFSNINFFVIPFNELLSYCNINVRKRLKALFCMRSRYLYAVILVVSLDFKYNNININSFSLFPDVFGDGIFYFYSNEYFHFLCVDIISFNSSEFSLFNHCNKFRNASNIKDNFATGYFNFYRRDFNFSSLIHIDSFFNKSYHICIKVNFSRISFLA